MQLAVSVGAKNGVKNLFKPNYKIMKEMTLRLNMR